RREETGYYEPYSHYHKNVRLWFLAYGIGAPVFLVQLPGALDTLRTTDLLQTITLLFLAGVIIQVGATLTTRLLCGTCTLRSLVGCPQLPSASAYLPGWLWRTDLS